MWNMFKVNNKNTRNKKYLSDVIYVVLIILLLTLNKFHTSFSVFIVDFE